MPFALSKEPPPVKAIPDARVEKGKSETVAQRADIPVGVEVTRPSGVILRNFSEEVDSMRMPVKTWFPKLVFAFVVFTVTARVVLVQTDFRVRAVGGTADTGGRLRDYVAADGRVLKEDANLGHC